ncbi:MAG: iron-sulfur cluster carrier protein ApbC [Legionella sp.]|nr:iron-sulfur cluster carrier protein ApbC [Legionella sp.]
MPTRAADIVNSIADPLLGLTLEEMGIKTTFIEKNNQLSVHLQAGFPLLSLQKSLIPLLKSALLEEFPSLQVDFDLDFFIKAHHTQLPGKGLRNVKNTIAIASGKGGVGKSTVTINLATALARAGAKVGILDADIYGPSIPLMLGKHEPVQISGEHYLPVLAHGVQAMSIGYLTKGDQALIWRGPMLAKSLIQMLDITLWDDLDYLFIDLPPGTGDIQLSLVQKIPLTAAVVVTTPQNVATLDAEKAIKMFETTGIDVLGVVENMSSHICSQCGHEDALFGKGGGEKLSNNFNIPLLGQLPLDSRIRRQCDEGTPTATFANDELASPFMKTALTIAMALSQKPLNYAGKFPPIIVE